MSDESSPSDLISVEATDEDRARWREEFKPRPVWIPQVHYHKKSRTYVEGIVPFDGCWVCDNQWPLVEGAMQRGEPVPAILSVVFTEEALDKMKRRIGIYGEAFFHEPDPDDLKPLPPATSLTELTLPNRDDYARWRKQFAGVLEKIKPVAKFTSKNEPEDEPIAPIVGVVQIGVFGGAEVIPFDRKRKRRKK